eukprot:3786831-Prymnesium_polylepis.2
MKNRLDGHVAHPPVRSSTRLRECAGATLPQPRRRRFPTPPPSCESDGCMLSSVTVRSSGAR